MAQKDGDGICFLLKECGGSVYQWKRLKIGVYALSKGCVDNLDLEKIFNYKFDDFCYAGPADTELEEDITSMVMTGYIDKERKKFLNHRTEHELINLLERGKKVAENFEMGLSRKEIENVKDVAKKLKDINITVADLLNMYCQEWKAQAAPKNLEATLTS